MSRSKKKTLILGYGGHSDAPWKRQVNRRLRRVTRQALRSGEEAARTQTTATGAA